MRRTLILIPHEIAGIPVFGFGWVLGLLISLCSQPDFSLLIDPVKTSAN